MSDTDHPRPPRRPRDPSLLYRAAEHVIDLQLGSQSMLQRRLGIGAAKAAALMGELEAHGVVGPAQDGRSREVLVVAGDRALVRQVLADFTNPEPSHGNQSPDHDRRPDA